MALAGDSLCCTALFTPTLAERVSAAYRPEIPDGPPALEVVRSDAALTLAEIDRLAVAAREAGHPELHLLAWAFAPDLARQLRTAPEPPAVPVRLVRLPRELFQPFGRKPPQFVEVGELTAERVFHPDGSCDVRLVEFRPGLPISPKPSAPALRERAERAGFDFLDYWAVDFDYNPAGPFRHQWRCGRSSRNRRLPRQSDAHVAPSATSALAVKVADVFGYETLTVLPTL